MIYFISDLHIGHENIIGMCERPFQTIDEMNETLISNWNNKVNDDDTVYILGDLFWEGVDCVGYLKRLKGHKILILGNHDILWYKDDGTFDKYFEKVTYMDMIPREKSPNGYAITMDHYPMLEWFGAYKYGEWNLGYHIFGHIHNKFLPDYLPIFRKPHALNASVEINNYEPVTLDELIENNREFKFLFFNQKDIDLYNEREQLILSRIK